MKYSNQQQQQQRGFTLIELSIVMIIGGILLVGVIKAYEAYVEKQKIEKMNSLMVDIDQYIKDFPNSIDPVTAAAFGRLPCPAPLDGSVAGNDFNQERCAGPGVREITGTGGERVLVGKLPAATLGISSDLMKDSYGNYLTYAVSKSATDAATYGSVAGAIEVIEEGVDQNPASPTAGQIIPIATHSNAQYIFVSAGESGVGAYAFDGAQAIACTEGDSKDGENCNGDHIFTVSARSDRGGNNFYDDHASFNNFTINVASNEPAGCEQVETITMFGNSCPDGWDENTSVNVNSKSQDRGNRRAYNRDYKNQFGQSTRYFNIDADTGDYYFSNFKTPETQQEQSGGRRIACEKREDNLSRTKCFPKQANVEVISQELYDWIAFEGQPGVVRKYDKLKTHCPDGYKPISAGAGSYPKGPHGPYIPPIKVLCGK